LKHNNGNITLSVVLATSSVHHAIGVFVHEKDQRNFKDVAHWLCGRHGNKISPAAMIFKGQKICMHINLLTLPLNPDHDNDGRSKA
jgi:hypothetical protein